VISVSKKETIIAGALLLGLSSISDLSNYGSFSKIGRKNHYLEFFKIKNWKEKPLP